MSLNDRIKEARLNAKLTQEQLAQIVGVAKSTITGYEKGNRIPTATMIGEIATATKVDANFLYQDEVSSSNGNYATPDEFENIIRKYRALDAHGKNMINMILQAEYERCNSDNDTAYDVDQAAEDEVKAFEDFINEQLNAPIPDIMPKPSAKLEESLRRKIRQFEKRPKSQ